MKGHLGNVYSDQSIQRVATRDQYGDISMQWKLTTSLIAIATSATVAHADGMAQPAPDPAVVTPAPTSVTDWSGLYGGLTAGYAMGSASHRFSNGAPTDDSDPQGFLVGGFLGYAVQSGKVVWGGEVDMEISDYSGSFVNNTGATSQGVIDGNWQGSVRGVVGTAGNLGARPALYYATAGWAVGEFDFLGGPSAPVPPGGGYSERMNGWTAGIGVDTRLTDSTAVRVEYRYTDFGTASGNLAPTFGSVTMPVDVTQHALRVGVRMQF
jgi:outer membrane immunogenic protein